MPRRIRDHKRAERKSALPRKKRFPVTGDYVRGPRSEPVTYWFTWETAWFGAGWSDW